VREAPTADGLGANWVHVGTRQELVWRHATQHKHHRWCLDGRQIKQYHLGGSLSADLRWWEAAAIPRRSLQIVDQGAVTVAPLVCEDLARLQPVADLLRSIGPSLVVSVLLDGPQLASRWTARYASVLADDPGSAVLTLTSYGMVRRCRPSGCPASSVVALWKDATGELTEIELEDGASAVLISTNVAAGDSFTADGRRHRGSTASLTLAAVHSLHVGAGDGPAPRTEPAPEPERRRLPPLDEQELSKATSWAEAVAEMAVGDPAALPALMADAIVPDWRAELGLRPPTRMFVASVQALVRELPEVPTLGDVLDAAGRLRRSEDPAAIVAGTLLEIALEQRLFAEVNAGRTSTAELEPILTRDRPP
jgi:hypothetical protein